MGSHLPHFQIRVTTMSLGLLLLLVGPCASFPTGANIPGTFYTNIGDHIYSNNPGPLMCPADELVCKAPDGNWKTCRNPEISDCNLDWTSIYKDLKKAYDDSQEEMKIVQEEINRKIQEALKKAFSGPFWMWG